MAKLEFKIYDKNNDLDFFNKILVKASQDRYELRIKDDFECIFTS